jgi:DNA-binding NarL/FixJ family response regulator
VAQQRGNAVAAISLLTRREADIFTLVKDGLSNQQIAEKLSISRRTVENILHCIYDKTGISSRLELQKM